MANRTVSYAFKANFTEFTAGLTAAGRGVQDFGTRLTALDRNGAQMRAGLDTIGRSAGRAGLLAAAGLGAIFKVTADFEQKMSAVQAATHETADNMELLRKAAIKAGADTAFSASEAANGIEELAKAGVATKDILAGGLRGALDLASAGALGVGEAAEIAASAMTQFGLTGDKVSHVADLLAAGAGKAQGSVTDLGYALKYVGVPANALGISIDETVGILGEFASAGIVGEQAGTNLRSILLSLAAPTGLATKKLEEYGIELYDSSGKFIGAQGAAQALQNGLGGLDDATRNAALSTIFGKEAIQGAITLYEGGGKAVADWTAKVNDQGYAADTAAIRLDNLKGDLEALGGSLETALIGAGSGSQAPLRGLVQNATEAVNTLNKMPPAAKNGAVAVLGITAVAGGAVFAFSRVTIGIAATRTALLTLGPAGARAGAGMAAATKGLLGLTLAYYGVKTASDALGTNVGSDAIDRMVKVLDAGAGTQLTDQINATAEAIKKYKVQADEGVSVNLGLFKVYSSDDASRAGEVVRGLTKHLKDLQGQQATNKAEVEAAGGSMAILADGTKVMGTAAEVSAAQLADLTKAMEEQRKGALDAFDANTAYRRALKDAQEQGKKNDAGIKGSSEAALENRDKISALAAAWNNQSEAVRNNQGRYTAAKAAFIKAAEGMGVTTKEAERLAKKYLEIPDAIVTKVTARTGQAVSAVTALKSLLDNLHDQTINITVNKSTNATLGDAKANDSTHKAYGGLVSGPGGPRDDLIPAMLSNNEFVMPADAVNFYGLPVMEAMRGKQLRSAVALAAGGQVVQMHHLIPSLEELQEAIA